MYEIYIPIVKFSLKKIYIQLPNDNSKISLTIPLDHRIYNFILSLSS